MRKLSTEKLEFEIELRENPAVAPESGFWRSRSGTRVSAGLDAELLPMTPKSIKIKKSLPEHDRDKDCTQTLKKKDEPDGPRCTLYLCVKGSANYRAG